MNTITPGMSVEEKLAALDGIASEQAKTVYTFYVRWFDSGKCMRRIFSCGSVAQEFAMALRSDRKHGITIHTETKPA